MQAISCRAWLRRPWRNQENPRSSGAPWSATEVDCGALTGFGFDDPGDQATSDVRHCTIRPHIAKSHHRRSGKENAGTNHVK